MKKKDLIVRILANSTHSEQNLNKVVGLIEPKSIIALISNVGLDANPRLSKTGKVTDAIIESLEKTPELFMFKTKGILVSTMDCEELDRGRYKISFNDSAIEGILDGGHNVLALGIHLLQKAFPDEHLKIKKWDDLLSYWDNFDYTEGVRNYIASVPKEEFFYVPFELIYPNKTNKDQYIDNILDISAARNNNAELTIATKANHAGFYDKLQKCLDPVINAQVEWKTNEPGKTIKSQDIVSLALIPMLALEKAGMLKINQTINRVSLYSSKGRCIKTFNDIMEAHSERQEDGDIVISDEYISSALDVMRDIPRLYDYIYELFPTAYNKKSTRFGGISAVTIQDGSGRPFTTKFYKKNVEYKYPDGFIYPVIASLSNLLEVKGGRVAWKVDDPLLFLKMHLCEITDLYIGHIKTHQYNPQSVGKDAQSYKLTDVMVSMVLAKNNI